MKIPYGISSFGMLRRDGYYYVDKTPFLPVLEQLPGLNVRTDYGHLRRLMSMAGAGVEERRVALETIVSEGAIESQLIRQFGFQSVSSREALVSLLYYMGLITLAEQSPYEDQKRLEIPNRVIRELHWEHLMALLEEQESLDFDAQDFRQALRKMAVEGQIQPFIDLFHDRVVKAIGNKELRRFDERAIKAEPRAAAPRAKKTNTNRARPARRTGRARR